MSHEILQEAKHSLGTELVEGVFSLAGDWRARDEDGEWYDVEFNSSEVRGLDKLFKDSLRKLWGEYIGKLHKEGAAEAYKLLGDPAPWPDEGSFIGDLFYAVRDGRGGIEDLGDNFNTRGYGDDENREEFELDLTQQLLDSIYIEVGKLAKKIKEPAIRKAAEDWLEGLEGVSWA
jgi:hypothetical protein